MDRGVGRGGGRYYSPRGRSSPFAGHSTNRHSSVGAHVHFRNASSGREGWQFRRKNPETTPVGVSCPSPPVENITSSAENLKLEHNTTKLENLSPKYQESASTPPNMNERRTHQDQLWGAGKESFSSPHLIGISSVDASYTMNERRTHQDQLWGAGKESFSSPHLIAISSVDASYTMKGPSQSGVSDSKESHFKQETQTKTGARNASSGREGWQFRRKNPETTPVGVSCPSPPVENITSSAENLKLEHNTTKVENLSPKYQESASTPPNMNERRTHQDQLWGAGKESFSSPHLIGISSVDASYTMNERRTHQDQLWGAGKESFSSPHLIAISSVDASYTMKGPSQSGVSDSKESHFKQETQTKTGARNASSGREGWQFRRKNPETTPVGVSCPSPPVENITSSAENLKLEHNTTKVENLSPKYQESASTPPNMNERRTHQDQLWGAGKESFSSPHLIGISSVDASYTMNERRTHQDQLWGAGKESFSSPHLIAISSVDASYTMKGPSQSGVSDSKESHFKQETQTKTGATENTVGDGRSNDSDSLQKGFSFDICVEKIGNFVKLKPTLLAKNRERRNEMKRRTEGENIKILRPGMVLLKCYLPLMDQVKLVKMCRDLGLGSGGFYQPGYRDGAQLRLKMMCLGKNWDPETSVYSDERPTDGAKPHSIPAEFLQLVKGAIQDSRDYLESTTKVRKVEDNFPSMSPNICIVNFYTQSGRLGLHQDKDESQESLRKGLPVVSFSMGDSAEFLYGEQRDIDKAQKVVLESGDVLIFGGKSRNIFHGVSSVIPNTAPKVLSEETNLRPGRLNLTFREY